MEPATGIPERVVSGGQTGVDRAALNVALAVGLDVGGWCPAGRGAEDGPIPSRYPLTETVSADPAERTRLNVRDSEATLILSPLEPSGGTRLALGEAEALRKPHLVVDPEADDAAERVEEWLRLWQPRVLNVAGPRESEVPGIYAASFRVLSTVLRAP